MQFAPNALGGIRSVVELGGVPCHDIHSSFDATIERENAKTMWDCKKTFGSEGPSAQMRDINIRIGNSNRLNTEWMHSETGSVTSPR